MTSPRLLKLLLIACVSFKRSPVAPESASLSEPAKSTRLRTPVHVSLADLLKPANRRVNTLWLRDDLSFIFVAPVALLKLAFRNIACNVAGESKCTKRKSQKWR